MIIEVSLRMTSVSTSRQKALHGRQAFAVPMHLLIAERQPVLPRSFGKSPHTPVDIQHNIFVLPKEDVGSAIR